MHEFDCGESIRAPFRTIETYHGKMMRSCSADQRSPQRRMWQKEQEVLHNRTSFASRPASCGCWHRDDVSCTNQLQALHYLSVQQTKETDKDFVSAPQSAEKSGKRVCTQTYIVAFTVSRRVAEHRNTNADVLRVLATDCCWAGTTWTRTRNFLYGCWNMTKKTKTLRHEVCILIGNDYIFLWKPTVWLSTVWNMDFVIFIAVYTACATNKL